MSYWIEIYNYDQLNSIIKDGVIRESFNVNSSNVNVLNKVRKICVGPLGSVHFNNLIDLGELEYIDCGFSFFGNLKSLNNLKYIGGSFRFGAPLKSLGNLEEIGGDFRPTTNDLEDLGNLIKVGGTVDLQGMINLKDLGKLEYVGDNLNLVKSLKRFYNLEKIKVQGRIIYWNKQSEFFKDEEKLTNERVAPGWESRGPYEFENNLVQPNEDQRKFYEYFKDKFYNGVYVDVGGMRNYIRYFIYELYNTFNTDKEFDKLVTYFDKLRTNYPFLSHDCDVIETDIGRSLDITKYKEIILPHEEYQIWISKLKDISRSVFGKYKNESEINEIITLLNIGFKRNVLTKFGQKNFDLILLKTVESIKTYELENGELFTNLFYDKGSYFKKHKHNSPFNPDYYKIFFISEEHFNKNLYEHNKRMEGIPNENKNYPKYFTPIVEFSIYEKFKSMARVIENEIRVERNLPKIGEGWISETDLFYKIKNKFSNYKVVHHSRPNWLRRQHFDIYFPDLNIAIEYQGKQHFEEVEFFGGKESLETNLINDALKKEKCKLNNCILIEVLPNYEADDIFNIIQEEIMKKTTANNT